MIGHFLSFLLQTLTTTFSCIFLDGKLPSITINFFKTNTTAKNQELAVTKIMEKSVKVLNLASVRLPENY